MFLLVLVLGTFILVPQGLIIAVSSYPVEPTSRSSLPVLKKLIASKSQIMQTTQGSPYLAGYQACLKRMNTNQLKFQIEYVYSVEGDDLTFTSDECVPPSVEVYWGWITFEGVETVLSKEKFVPMNFSINYHELMVWFPSPDLSTYYCYWMDRDTIVISNVWTVEVVGVSRMKKLSARKWRKEKRKSASVRNNMPVGLSIGKTHLTVETIWSEWSLCSKCGKDVGKRFKTGVCSVTRADDAENLEALSIHKLPVSCSLLIDFHPEILTEADVLRDFGNLKAMNEVLGRPHRIVVGYCRGQRVCDLKLGLKIIELYKNFEMMGDGEEISGDKVEIKWWSVRYLFWLVEGLFRGVPIGWRYTPDKILFIGLVGIQLYIIILVVRRRKQAK